MTVCTWITKGVSVKNKHTSLIRECLELSKRRNKSVSIYHVYREGNWVADFLAKNSSLSKKKEKKEKRNQHLKNILKINLSEYLIV